VEPGLAGLGAALAQRFSVGRCVVVTNPVVGSLYARALREELAHAGWTPILLEVPDGEANKSLASWESLVRALLASGVDRRTPVLALGGGVTGDLVGFAAATVLRGVPLVQVPTTLLAMVDASVGGKTGVNTTEGKNLVGAFHQPALVWAPLATLATLPDPELRCGFGEVVKHAVLSGEEALRACELLAPALVGREAAALARVVVDSIQVKAAIVAEDPLENGRRAVLNLGHTVGHALERVCGYGALRHGEAVALGLLAVARWTAGAGLADAPDLTGRLARLLAALELPVHAPGSPDPGALAAAVGFDKKRVRAKIRIVVPRAPGQVVLHDLPVEEVPNLIACLSPGPLPAPAAPAEH
jgi:3-dehydroquinate synthase